MYSFGSHDVILTGGGGSEMDRLTEDRGYLDVFEAEIRKIIVLPKAYKGLLVAEWFLISALVWVFIAHAIIPGWQTLGSEFPDYYLAAELYHRGIPLDRAYEWTWFQRQNDHLGVRQGLVSFAPNPPSLVLSLLPFSTLQPLNAKRAWIVLSLLLLALSVLFLHCATSLRWVDIVLITLLCVLPLSSDIKTARHYVLIFFLICAAYYAMREGHSGISGALWSVAAVLKLFPALIVILFLRKRNWRAMAGFLLGGTTLMVLSILLFGVEVHRVFILDVLTQASRGDWLGPYVLTQNSFITLWSHLFLVEPELNPFPWIDSPQLYAIVLALTTTVLLFAFLVLPDTRKKSPTPPLQWAAIIPMMLLLSTNVAADYSCLLIFSAVVAVDALLNEGAKMTAIALLFLYVAACAPVPHWISHAFPLSRLVATTSLYVLMLHRAGLGKNSIPPRVWLAGGLAFFAVLILHNLHGVKNRAEDFGRRVITPGNAYMFANPVPVMDQLAYTEMRPTKYGIAFLRSGAVDEIPVPEDVLAVAGSAASSSLYSELSSRRSVIATITDNHFGSMPQVITDGQHPALSPNGKWLAIINETLGRGTVTLLATDAPDHAQVVLPSTYNSLEVTVSNDGNVIAAAGSVSDPHLLFANSRTGEITQLDPSAHPARYPSISPDGRRLAYTRRVQGSWLLFVRTLATGYDEQLTHAACNAYSPSWADIHTLLYATDCGRGIGLSAIARVVIVN
jgi:hypothetical protein